MSAPLAQNKLALKPGDVLSYIPERDHCRERTAFVTERGVAVDTYWQGDYRGGYQDAHRLTDDELATATVRFNVSDYDALDLYSKESRPTWETYHPDDRGAIPSQHGLQWALFVRKGAQPHLDTQIENARAAVEQADSKMRSAEATLARRRDELAELEARRD